MLSPNCSDGGPLNTHSGGLAVTHLGAQSPPGGKTVRHRVLLVEDHADFAEATAALMRHHGLDVSIATSGGEALKMAEECNPDLVLCDLTLPDMTGLDVVRALRARRGANGWLAVILSAMSANHLGEIEGHTRTSDITLMLPKPLTSPILSDLIARLEAIRPSVGSA
jgi:CheY-like chemotaxis protein